MSQRKQSKVLNELRGSLPRSFNLSCSSTRVPHIFATLVNQLPALHKDMRATMTGSQEVSPLFIRGVGALDEQPVFASATLMLSWSTMKSCGHASASEASKTCEHARLIASTVATVANSVRHSCCRLEELVSIWVRQYGVINSCN